VLENATVYAMADLDNRVSGGQEKRRQIGVEPASVTVCNYNVPMSTSRRGWPALEEGAYT